MYNSSYQLGLPTRRHVEFVVIYVVIKRGVLAHAFGLFQVGREVLVTGTIIDWDENEATWIVKLVLPNPAYTKEQIVNTPQKRILFKGQLKTAYSSPISEAKKHSDFSSPISEANKHMNEEDVLAIPSSSSASYLVAEDKDEGKGNIEYDKIIQMPLKNSYTPKRSHPDIDQDTCKRKNMKGC